MSIKSPVLSEFTLVKFDVLGNTYAKTPSEAKSFVEGLLATSHATTLKFTELVPCRSIVLKDTSLQNSRVKLQDARNIVLEQNSPKIRHAHHMCYLKGPLTPQEFIQMMEFKKGISNEEWNEYMDRFSRIAPIPKL